MIKVCLVEDQTLVREGIQSLLHLTEDIRVVATASDGEEASEIIEAAKPDVVLLDVRIPKKNGLEVLRELQQFKSPPPRSFLQPSTTTRWCSKESRQERRVTC
jgi:YesN/AraC family two-component response regulator